MQGFKATLFLCVATLFLSAYAPSPLLESAADQPAALAALEAIAEVGEPLGEDDVLLTLDRGWFDAAKVLLRLLRTRGEAVATLASVRARATTIRDEATEVINLMRVGANAEATDVNCAFQWAQKPEAIYLNVKFSSRIDGPVTVLNVDNEKVSLTNDSLIFEAVGRQKPKTFKLNLTFYGEIVPESSSWSFASVGRMSFTIAKKERETWPRLLTGKAKPKNMYAWYERQTVLDAEVKAEAKAAKEAEDAKKASENNSAEKKAPPPLPPTPTPPADGSPPSSSPKTTGGDGGAAPKKKKKKKKAVSEKDEV
jgi:hypothetical protein